MDSLIVASHIFGFAYPKYTIRLRISKLDKYNNFRSEFSLHTQEPVQKLYILLVASVLTYRSSADEHRSKHKYRNYTAWLHRKSQIIAN